MTSSDEDNGELPIIGESKFCVRTILELLASQPGSINLDFESKILDFCACRGKIGTLLAEHGFTEIYAQDGQEARKHLLKKTNAYKDIKTYIVGKHAGPKEFKNAFDIVTCSAAFGSNLIPARGFNDII